MSDIIRQHGYVWPGDGFRDYGVGFVHPFGWHGGYADYGPWHGGIGILGAYGTGFGAGFGGGLGSGYAGGYPFMGYGSYGWGFYGF